MIPSPHSPSRRRLLLGIAAAALLPPRAAAAEVAVDDEAERRAHRIEEALIAPCCFQQTLANHSSPKADEMKRQIRALLATGLSEEEVLARFVAIYGERILAAPTTRGFNLLAWSVPPLALFAAALASFLWLRRRKAVAAAAPQTHWDPAHVERLRAELAEMR